jgi:hypothetical protein
MMRRRVVLGVLVLLLAGSVAGWIFYMPSKLLRPLRAVPAEAQTVYRNATPAWFLAFFKNPSARFSERWNRRFRELERYPLTVAALPAGGYGRRAAWVAVSVVGRRTAWLRWQLAFTPPDGVTVARSCGGWPVWQYDDPSLPSWMRVRFSVAEGLLIFSISDDSRDIYYLLDTLDGRRPSADNREQK